MLTAKEIYDLPQSFRAERITREITGYSRLDDKRNMERSLALCSVINQFIEDYFQLQVNGDKRLKDGSVLNRSNLEAAMDNEIEAFYPIAAAEIDKPKIDASNPVNLYQMAGASKLSLANTVTRNLSTTLGLLWERIADISPYAINPELEFNLKIQGIDLIGLNINKFVVEYIQLKTQHNTLTGSQKPRSVSELSIHENPVFCAAFYNKSNWTFRDANIPRRSGAEFWETIGISYEIFLDHVFYLVKRLEEDYVNKLNH